MEIRELVEEVCLSVPELRRLSIKYNRSSVKEAFTASRLIPSLLFKLLRSNSAPQAINIYNSDFWIRNYLPLILILFDVKEKQKALVSRTKFQNLNFKDDDIKVPSFEGGSVCHLVGVDFTNGLIRLKKGNGSVLTNALTSLSHFNFSLYPSPKIGTICRLIEDYNVLKGDYSESIYHLLQSGSFAHNNTVLYFTNKTQYTTVTNKSQISNFPIKDLADVAYISYNKGFNIKYLKKSVNRNCIVICSLKYWPDVEEILSKDFLHHRNIHIITDDTSEIKAIHTTGSIKSLPADIMSKNKQVRCVISFFEETKIFDSGMDRNSGKSHSIFISGAEKHLLDYNRRTERVIELIEYVHEDCSLIIQAAYQCAVSFKLLIKEMSYDNGALFKIINILWQFRSRLESFHDQEDLQNFVSQSMQEIGFIRENVLDYPHLTQYFKRLFKLLEEPFSSLTYQKQNLQLILENSKDAKSVLVFSRNNNAADQTFLSSNIRRSLAAGKKVEIVFKDIQDKFEPEQMLYDLVLFFIRNDRDDKVNKLINSFALGGRIVVAGDDGYLRVFRRSFQKKAELCYSFLRYKYDGFNIDTTPFKPAITERILCDNEEPLSPDYTNDLENATQEADTLEALFLTLTGAEDEGSKVSDQQAKVPSAVLVMQDGTVFTFPITKKLYRYSEDATTIAKLRCSVDELSKDDLILLLNKDEELDLIIEAVMEKSDKLKKHFRNYILWRKNLDDFLIKNDMSLEAFRNQYLKDRIKTNAVIRAWINGDIKMPRKENFLALLMVMKKIGILPSDVNGDQVFDSTTIIKSKMMKITRDLVSKYVSDLNDIVYKAELEHSEIYEKLYDLVEVKRVNFIIK